MINSRSLSAIPRLRPRWSSTSQRIARYKAAVEREISVRAAVHFRPKLFGRLQASLEFPGVWISTQPTWAVVRGIVIQAGVEGHVPKSGGNDVLAVTGMV